MAQLSWLPGHGLYQFSPFLAHLCMLGAILCAVAMLPERESVKASLVGWQAAGVVNLFSFISLFLAAGAITHLTAKNAPALLLIPPVLTFFAAVFSSGLLRGGEKQSAKQPEPENRIEQSPVSVGSAVWSAVAATIANAVYFTVVIAAVFGEMYVGVIWGFGMWAVLGGAQFNSIKPFVVGLHYIAQPPILLILTAFAAFLLLLRLVGEAVPIWASVFTYIRFSRATEAQRDLVQTRFHALWDYANGPRLIRPMPLAAQVAMLAIPIAISVCALLLAFKNEELANWLFPPGLHGPGWYLLERHAGFEMMILFLSSLLVAGSVHRLTIELWPPAFEGAIISPLRRGTLNTSRFRSFMRALLQGVRKGAISNEIPFDPRAYLRARYLRRGRRLYILTAVVFLFSALFAWRGLASYTLIDGRGFETVHFFTDQPVFHRYQDATKVLLFCDWRQGDYSYDVVFRDQDRVDVSLKGDDVRKKLPALVRIDDTLRQTHVGFVPVARSQPTLSGPECVRSLARREYSAHEQSLARIMHVD